jgi:lipopolysaccharide/colanic/teichoic acid biosynthesis glycosyltransferase
LSGWAQINFHYGSSIADAAEKLKYDLYYIKNRSLILDLGIALKTIRIMFQRSGK